MKCPEWLIEGLREGTGVVCHVWDGDNEPVMKSRNVIAEVTAFDVSGEYHFFAKGMGWLKNAEPWGVEKAELTPGLPVLVRDFHAGVWKYDLFSHMRNDDPKTPYVCAGGVFCQCIPYQGNEGLCGKVK